MIQFVPEPALAHLGLYYQHDTREYGHEASQIMGARYFYGVPRAEDEDYDNDTNMVALVSLTHVGPMYYVDGFVQQQVGEVDRCYQWNVFSSTITLVLPPP